MKTFDRFYAALLAFCFLVMLSSCSKERVLQVNQFPNQTADGSDIYVTGSFNNWNPADPNAKMEYDNVLRVYTLELPDGATEGYYMYTRGTDESIESDVCGNDRTPRTLTNAEMSIDSIAGWSDLDHPHCPEVIFIVRSDIGKVPASDSIYLATQSSGWEDGNNAYLFALQPNGTSVLHTSRSPQTGLLFNVFHNGIRQFERPVEVPTFNDTITLTLSASVAAEVRKEVAKVASRRTKNPTQLPPAATRPTITLDAPPVRVVPIPPRLRLPAPPPETNPATTEAPNPSPAAETPKVAPAVETPKPAVTEAPKTTPTEVPKPAVVVAVPKPSVKAPVAKPAPNPAPVVVAPAAVPQPADPDKRKKVIVIIDKIPTYGKDDNFYAAGDFNDWNVADPNYQFRNLANGKRFLVIRLNDNGEHEFKVTRGQPGTDEANYKEEPIDFHEIGKGSEDDTIHIRIDSWLDAYARQRLVFYLIDVPENTPEGAPIYLTGDFNKWNLNEERYKFTYLGDDKYALTIDDFSNYYQEFKITRGSLQTEAVARNGRVPRPQPFAFIRRDTMRLRIERWKDLK
jgi:hypothetical protein